MKVVKPYKIIVHNTDCIYMLTRYTHGFRTLSSIGVCQPRLAENHFRLCIIFFLVICMLLVFKATRSPGLEVIILSMAQKDISMLDRNRNHNIFTYN